ncbi:hypothetical protein ACFOLL_10970 [Falsochrobactrum ovis]|uniref:Secreted protein n=1 Tax=Falsochrobactrum ovis TaxID=1293442 RepID=A0A364JRS9_9HYPH|nr:hypothetical protein [Falsochrobactrum ovis]RAK25601.1 hypothetical protein C7374_12218 [Falsochrobactrum ovis]
MRRSTPFRRTSANRNAIRAATTLSLLAMLTVAFGTAVSTAAPGREAGASSTAHQQARVPDCRPRLHREAPQTPCSSEQPASQTRQKEHQQ